MRRIILFILLVAMCDAFYVKNNTDSLGEEFGYTLGGHRAEELRSKSDSIELFGRRVDVPEWMNTAAGKTRGMFESVTSLFGKGTSTSRKSTDGLVTNLKEDEATRIMFAVYLNVLAIILIYVFITIKLALLSLSEGNQERKKRNHFSSHVAFDAPDFNLPLASIATRTTRQNGPLSMENPLADFEMAREAREEEVIRPVVPVPIDFDAIPSTEREESF